MHSPLIRRKTLVVLKGYPRLSETFIAQELLGLERAGFDLTLISMRKPTDKKRHPIHDEIKARVVYLPEYLHEEPFRVLRALVACWKKPNFKPLLKRFWADLRRDVSRNRFRRLGQALVLAHEWPDAGEWLHAHFIHTPASVTRLYQHHDWRALDLLGPCQGHLDVAGLGTDGEARRRRAGASPVRVRASSTCVELTKRKDQVHLSYHGLDLARFGHFDTRSLRAATVRTGRIRCRY